MRYLSPIETVNGEVIDVIIKSTRDAGYNNPPYIYTWVIIRDAQSEMWILQHDGQDPFEKGENYSFEVQMWPCGSYTGSHVDHVTDVYPIASYE